MISGIIPISMTSGYLGTLLETCFVFLILIEHGPLLESHDMEIGVVTGSQAMNWSHVVVEGKATHAGTTPMVHRKDALACATRLLQRAYDLGNSIEDGRTTIGVMNAYPSSHSTVPNRVEMTLDLRHPDEATLERQIADFDDAAAEENEKGFVVRRSEFGIAKALSFDKGVTAAIRAAATTSGYRHCDIVSGAGHDATYVSETCPTGMIFVPCREGISHHPDESITPEQAHAGVDVLMRTALELAESAPGP